MSLLVLALISSGVIVGSGEAGVGGGASTPELLMSLIWKEEKRLIASVTEAANRIPHKEDDLVPVMSLEIISCHFFSCVSACGNILLVRTCDAVL